MRIYSAHFHPRSSPRAEQPPVLVGEGFSWSCLILGWIGLLLSGSWIAALLAAAVTLVLGLVLRPVVGG